MENWSDLIEAGKDLRQAFALLDRADEMAAVDTAAGIITRMGLIEAARGAVDTAALRLGRPRA